MIGFFYNKNFDDKNLIYDILFLRIKTVLDKYDIENKIFKSFQELKENKNDIDILIVDLIFSENINKKLENIFENSKTKIIFIFNKYQYLPINSKNEVVDIFSNLKISNFLERFFKIKNENIWKYPKFCDDYLNYTFNNFVFRSMSCKYNCSFCNLNKNNFIRNVEYIINELKFVNEKYKNIIIRFFDYNFLDNKINAINLLDEIIKHNLTNNQYYIETVLETFIDKNIIKKMEEANIKIIKTGIDYLYDDFRNKIILKHPSKDILFEKLKLFKNSNIKFKFNFLIGHPQETKEIFEKNFEDFKKFIDKFYELIDEIYFYTFRDFSNYFKGENFSIKGLMWKNKNSNFIERKNRCDKMIEYIKKYNINFKCN